MKKNINNKRKSVLRRLEDQLQVGSKVTKEGVIPLSESDKRRITKEIQVLKDRIK